MKTVTNKTILCPVNNHHETFNSVSDVLGPGFITRINPLDAGMFGGCHELIFRQPVSDVLLETIVDPQMQNQPEQLATFRAN